MFMLKNNMSIMIVVGNTAEVSLCNIQACSSNFLVQIIWIGQVANRDRSRMVHESSLSVKRHTSLCGESERQKNKYASKN